MDIQKCLGKLEKFLRECDQTERVSFNDAWYLRMSNEFERRNL